MSKVSAWAWAAERRSRWRAQHVHGHGGVKQQPAGHSAPWTYPIKVAHTLGRRIEENEARCVTFSKGLCTSVMRTRSFELTRVSGPGIPDVSRVWVGGSGSGVWRGMCGGG